METLDPRPDLTTDSREWSDLLTRAYLSDGHDPDGLFGTLHGLRCCGGGLVSAPAGGYRLVAGAMDEADYRRCRERYLVPQRAVLMELLGPGVATFRNLAHAEAGR